MTKPRTIRITWIGPDARIPGVGDVKRGDTLSAPSNLGGQGRNWKPATRAKPKTKPKAE